FGTVDTAATVEGALGPQKLRSIQPCLVVAPQHMAIATLEPHVELAIGRRVLQRYRVVAVYRIVLIGIDPPQQGTRILCRHSLEEVLDLVLARVGRGRQEVLSLDLA